MNRAARAIALALLLATAYSAPAQQNTLRISTQPGSAQVYLNDEPKGTTSADEGKMVLKDLPAGSHKLRIALSGYKDWVQSVTLTEGSTVYVDAKLAVAGLGPLTSPDVVDLLKGGVSPKRATDLVKEHGVDFALDDAIEKEIRAAGGDDTLLLVITKAKVAPAPAPPPTMPPTITVLEPAGAEKGREIQVTGPTLRVRGNASHPSGIVSVSVNGQAAVLKAATSEDVEFEVPNLSLASGSSALVLIATAADRSQVQLVLKAKPTPKTPAQAETKVNPKDGLTYVWIPAGTFQMGCSTGGSGCSGDESPAHTVTITKGFWMGQTEVTQGAYQRVMSASPSHFHGDRLPVEQVSWNEANAYCTAVGMRLPTEAEWEYAARAGSTASRYGDIAAIAWYGGNSENQTHEVGQKQPNAWKLYDMLGNVEEWVADWYDVHYYSQSPSQDPQGPLQGQDRTLRGGMWFFDDGSTPSIRSRRKPGFRSGFFAGQWASNGFRCAGE